MVAKEILEILVCPLTKSSLYYDIEKQELISHEANLAYQVINGIPVMLIDEARVLNQDISII